MDKSGGRKRTLLDFYNIAVSSNSGNSTEVREVTAEGEGQTWREESGTVESIECEHSTDNNSDPENSQNEEPQKKKLKKSKVWKFQDSWTEKWPWVVKPKDGTGMKCSLCVKHKKDNKLTIPTGNFNYRTSTLRRHANRSDHIQALRDESLQHDFEKSVEQAKKKNKDAHPGVLAAMRTVFFMAQEDIPSVKYPKFMEFQKVQGNKDIQGLSVAGNATYMSRTAGEEMMSAIAEAIHKDTLQNIKASEMYSVMVDESTDISVNKHMIVFVRIVDNSFSPKTYFLKNITIDNPKSDSEALFNALANCLREEGLSLEKIIGFGSDGAAVMVGKHKGVAVRIQNESPHCVAIHCMAHRFNLATSQASKNIDAMKEFERTLSDLYYYFGGSKSGNRKCELEEIQKVLDLPIIKIKECHEIRWLAFMEAVHAIYKTWLALVEYFKKHKDKKSKSFHEALTTYKFVAFLHMLMDVLPSVAQISLLLQKRDIDIAVVQPALEGLKNRLRVVKNGNSHYQEELRKERVIKMEHGHTKSVKFKGQSLEFGVIFSGATKEIAKVRSDFCDNLNRNIEERFPPKSMNVAQSFHIFGMRPLSLLSEAERNEYGKQELEILVNHYGEEKRTETVSSKPVINPAATREEWSILKTVVLSQMYPRDRTIQLWNLIYKFHRDTFPNLITLAKIALMMPYQTADCERGFSCQNYLKSIKRNRMEEHHLNCLMTIKCEGGHFADYDFGEAHQLWKKNKERRLFKK